MTVDPSLEPFVVVKHSGADQSLLETYLLDAQNHYLGIFHSQVNLFTLVYHDTELEEVGTLSFPPPPSPVLINHPCSLITLPFMFGPRQSPGSAETPLAPFLFQS